MKRIITLLVTAVIGFGTFLTATPTSAAAVVYGMDVSHYQGAINWGGEYSKGARFAYMKATEGTGYTDPNFDNNYIGSYNAGFIRGAYHFALPDRSSGAYQADFFLDNGGGWSADGKTLPGALDIEYNPYGANCYGLSQSSMVGWVRSFSDEYRARVGVYPVIYTTTDWWTTCTGNSSAFAATSPLWLARYSSSPGALPAGWGYYTFWQNADSGTFPGDQDQFNGDYSQLQRIACAC